MRATDSYKTLQRTFLKHQNAELAVAMSAYMRHQFHFLGIPKPIRSKLEKLILQSSKTWSITTIHKISNMLWSCKSREFQYTALELLWINRKLWNTDTLKCLEYFILHKSWWDTVDILASKLIGWYMLQQPKAVVLARHKLWLSSNNMWLQRTCLIFQLKYKDKTNFTLLKTTIMTLKDHPDFFIQKAIGWSLRQYAKTHPVNVITFCKSINLNGLAKREALKHIN
jgi:3-methyladenine DNA glycosylase AlkD